MTANPSNEEQGLNVDPSFDVIFQNALGGPVSDVVVEDECCSDEEFRILCASLTSKPADLDLATIARTGETCTAQTTADTTYLSAQ